MFCMYKHIAYKEAQGGNVSNDQELVLGSALGLDRPSLLATQIFITSTFSAAHPSKHFIAPTPINTSAVLILGNI